MGRSHRAPESDRGINGRRTGQNRPAAGDVRRKSACAVPVPLTTRRLLLRGWQVDDADEAVTIFGRAEVTRWLGPAVDSVSDLAAMRRLLRQWIAEDARIPSPGGTGVPPRTPGQSRHGRLVSPSASCHRGSTWECSSGGNGPSEWNDVVGETESTGD